MLLVGCLMGCGEDAGRGAAESAGSTPTPSSPSSSPQDATDEPTTASPEPTSPEPTSPEPGGASAGTRIVVDDSEFGPMLFDSTGQAIYLFDVETSPDPQCYGDCATAWPPVLTDRKPVPGAGVDSGLLGTTERTDGTQQVTYDGHPLYFSAHEGKNEVKCHDVFLNGGNWYVVEPSGDAAPPG